MAGIDLVTNRLLERPDFALSVLSDPTALATLVDELGWFRTVAVGAYGRGQQPVEG